MPRRITRRTMLRGSALAGAGALLSGFGIRVGASSPNETMGVAVIGPGGRGRANLNGVAKEKNVAIVGICDVDDQRAGDAYRKFPQAKKYYDFRKMLEELDGSTDAVIVSTPDHTHAHPSLMALGMGKHLYCEKPMAHNVWECRRMTDLAREKKVATQLGVQRHTIPNMHRIVELIQSGAIGEVTEVHSWVGGSRGMPGMPKEFPPVPAHLKWDLWLGPARWRPYSPAYCPYNWRFWWDFGTGETGNWGCHILDIPFWSLGLDAPTRVEGSGPEVHSQMTPKSMRCRFEFPARGSRGPVALHWYHGTPPILAEKKVSLRGANNLFIGSKGMLLCGFGSRKLFPEDKFKDFVAPPKTVPDSPGFYREWVDACRGGPAATCHFDYSGPMAETVLLGNVAYRIAGGFDWDSKGLRAVGAPEAAPYLKESYRDGWSL